MARIRGQLVVTSVPRGWLEQLIDTLYEFLMTLRVEDGSLVEESGEPIGVLLVEGRHATAGAHYQLAETNGASLGEVVLTGLDRAGETSVEVRNWSDEGTAVFDVRLHSVARPSSLLVDGVYEASRVRPRALARVSWMARLDFEQWWKRADRRGGGRHSAPLIVEVDHRLARAAVQVVPHRGPREQWAVTLKVTLTGRSLLRPLAAVPLLFARRAMRRAFQEELDAIAKEWNTAIPDAVRADPRDFVRREPFLGRSAATDLAA